MKLLDELKKRQGARAQADFARELGITPAALSRIYKGDRQIGISIARRIRKRYPDLTWMLAQWLLDDDAA